MICLLADVGLRASEPDLAFGPFERLETGFLTGRGFEVSFGSIPKMPIMGLLESLLGIGFRFEQPAATYRARFYRLPIGGTDIAGDRESNYEVLRIETSSRGEFSIDIANSPRRFRRKKNYKTFSELANAEFRASILEDASYDSQKIPAGNRLPHLKKLFTGTPKRIPTMTLRVIFCQNAH
jgi:hypothetical protein